MTLVSSRRAQVSRSPGGLFELEVRSDRDVVRLEPSGELDTATAPLVRRQVDELVRAGFARLVIDLRGLEFIDCSGVRLLVELDAEARSDGWRLTLIQGRDAIQRVFSLTDTLARLPFTSADGLGARPR